MTVGPEAGPSDAELAVRARAGDLAAFDRLVERHLRRAYALAYWVLGDREDAEDVVQEAFVRAYTNLHRYDGRRPFAPWFYRILLNRALNWRRSRQRRRTEALPLEHPASDPPPDRAAERAEARAQLEAALAALTPVQRAIVELFELEGMTSEEIGAALGLRPGTVRWHLHRARALLRAQLGETNDEAAPSAGS